MAATTLVPTLLLAGAELGLRLFRYGHSTEFFVKRQINGRNQYTSNEKFGWRFFERALARRPQRFAISAVKPPGAYRIFVLGSSAAMGDPDPAFGFARILQTMLQHRYPRAEFEVANAAMTAINSHTVLSIARDCAKHQPDFFVVYMGNNEVVGPFGPGTVFSPFTSNLSLIRTAIWAKGTQMGQLLVDLGRRTARQKATPVSWRGMEMFLGNQVRDDDPRMVDVYDHYRENLIGICKAGRSAGAKIVLSTVATNLKDCAPFGALHRLSLTDREKARWEGIYRSGSAMESAGQFAQALQRYQEAENIDHDFADLYFRQGRCFWALGKYAEARDAYRRARDLDTLRFRADSRINEIIRQVSHDQAAQGLYLVDSEQACADHSANGIAGATVFLDHVHLNFSGNYLLARLICEVLARALPQSVKTSQQGALLTEQECAERLAFTGWNRYGLAASMAERFKVAPFTNQLDHLERDRRMQQEVERLRAHTHPDSLRQAVNEYRRALQMNEHDWMLQENLARLLWQYGDAQGAAEQWRMVLALWPDYAEAHNNLGVALAQQGQLDEAVAHYRAALQIDPADATARNNLGAALARQGSTEQASREFDEALRLRPNYAEPHFNWGNLLAEQGKVEEAFAHYRQALALRPDYAAAHKRLGNTLATQGQSQEAISHYRAALNIKPDDAEAHNDLAAALDGLGQIDEAIIHYSEALRIKPDYVIAHYNLGTALARLGRFQEAARHLTEAVRLNPGSADPHYNLANVLARRGKLDEAVFHYSKALRIDPGHAGARANLQAALRLEQKRRQGTKGATRPR